jgi:hypothetical protein
MGQALDALTGVHFDAMGCGTGHETTEGGGCCHRLTYLPFDHSLESCQDGTIYTVTSSNETVVSLGTVIG